jgi:hypothetical protein
MVTGAQPQAPMQRTLMQRTLMRTQLLHCVRLGAKAVSVCQSASVQSPPPRPKRRPTW